MLRRQTFTKPEERIQNTKPTLIRVVIGLYILIHLEIYVVFINLSKIYRFLNFFGLVFTYAKVLPRM